MVAYIRDLAVTRKRWLSRESFEEGIALAQSIPGATSMQAAGYVGLRAGGARGAAAAFAGFGLPAFVLMLVLSALYHVTHDLHPIVVAFQGLHLVVVAIVASAALDFGLTYIRNRRDAILVGGAGLALVSGESPVIVVVAAAALGVLLYQIPAAPSLAPAEPAPESRFDTVRFGAVFVLSVAGGLAALFLVRHALLDLASVMLRVGVFSFGGGMGAIPVMQHAVVQGEHWLKTKEFLDGITLGQITPGPVMITATFVGYEVSGPLGAIVGTVAVFAPSFFILLVLVPYFDILKRSEIFRRALRGILVSFVGLLAAVAVLFGAAVTWTVPGVLLSVAALVALRLRADTVYVVLAGAAISMLIL